MAMRKDKFKEIVYSDQLIVLPGAFDCICAKLIEKIGYQAVYVGSYATAASMYGLPDVNLIERKDMVDQAARIAGSTNLPVIADGENGYGGVLQVQRTVELFENAGIAGIHIEDHEAGKHMDKDVPQQILDLNAMVIKIQAAVDARKDKNFLIIGRTDILLTSGDFEGAIERCHQYLEAGADLAFIAGFKPHHLPMIKGRLKNKLVVSCTSPYNVKKYEECGIKLLIYYSATLLTAYHALEQLLSSLKKTGSIENSLDHMVDQKEFENFIGYPKLLEVYKRYYIT